MNPVVRKVILGVDLRQIAAFRGDDGEAVMKSSVAYALQTLFSALQWSKRRAVWPEDLIGNYRDFEGNRINTDEQMDAHEFFNFLFDHVEREMAGTKAEKMLKDEFCGKEVNQVICQECGYVSESFVPMYAVSCKIQGHASLDEALEHEFVRGDWLKGGNAYRCSKCDKKVTALKRSCFTQLADTMMVHLQRFEFNLETMLKVKINSECKFPLALNMKRFTKEWLDADGDEQRRAEIKDADFEYELVGITVHSGMADLGHYYSFIREQSGDNASNPNAARWFSFNDDLVSNFDASTIGDACFGGNKLTLVRDAKTQQLVQRWTEKSNNAYILVYRRRSAMRGLDADKLAMDDALLATKAESEEAESAAAEVGAVADGPDADAAVPGDVDGPGPTPSGPAVMQQSETSHTAEDEDTPPQINAGHKAIAHEEHHLFEVAESLHWQNARFLQKCQLCDLCLVDFLWRFLNQRRRREVCTELPARRHLSGTVRNMIGSLRTRMMLHFMWDVLCKFDAATAIPDENTAQGHKQALSRSQLRALTPLFEWTQRLQAVMARDVESAYLFLHLLRGEKRIWLRYLLEAKQPLVRECLVDAILAAIRAVLPYERELYYVRERDLDVQIGGDDDEIDVEASEERRRELQEAEDDELACNRITPDRSSRVDAVEWFASGSVVVGVLDAMCALILNAAQYWRRFRCFWQFFQDFAALGVPEKQLLLDRHLIIECYRLYHAKKPFDFGLKQLVPVEKKNTKPYKIGGDADPDCDAMVAMMSELVLACPFRRDSARDVNGEVQCEMPAADLKVCNDPRLWCKLLEDNQNPRAIAKMVCHLCWRNAEYSRKTCKELLHYLEEYDDKLYPAAFTVLRQLLALKDFEEEIDDDDEDDEDLVDAEVSVVPSIRLTYLSHVRCDRFIAPALRLAHAWCRDKKYMASVAKIAHFLQVQAQSNATVASFFRIKRAELLGHVNWLNHFLSSGQYRHHLNLSGGGVGGATQF